MSLVTYESLVLVVIISWLYESFDVYTNLNSPSLLLKFAGKKSYDMG